MMPRFATWQSLVAGPLDHIGLSSSRLTQKLVSQRGVVFFRNQDLTIDQQKVLGQKLGELTGKPETSKLHKHALLNSKRGLSVDENGRVDDEISIISSEQNRRYYEDRYKPASKHLASDGWHAE
jgi:alpha-ketoglutarate-dependent taurine dioxygenase